MKRFIASAGALVLATAMLASCSAYKNPEKYITVPELSSVKISQADLDKEMQETIDKILEDNREEKFEEVKDGVAQLGDQVNIDYEGKPADSSVTLSEKTLSGMKAEKQDLILGSGSMIGAYNDKDGNLLTEGFEEQILNMKAGETKDITVTFPDKYSNDTTLQGVKVIFTITVHTVSRLVVDEDALVEVEYEFEEPSESEEGSNDEGTEGEGDNAEAQSEDTKKDEDSDYTFEELFEAGKFEINYSEETEEDETFNEIFKVADYRDLFIGMNLYGTKTETITVPEDVDDDFKAYAGKEISVTFKVASATVLPEWNDELVKEYTSESYTTVAAYEEAMMESIKKNAAYEAVLEAITVDEYPERETKKLYKQYVDQQIDQYVQQYANKTLDEMTQSELDKLMTEETYESIYASAATQALADVKEQLVWEYLFEELDITLSKDEYKEALEKEYNDNLYYYYYYYGMLFANADELEDSIGKDNLEQQFKFAKVYDLLPEKITIEK